MRLIDADKIPEVSCDPKEEAAFRQTIDEQPAVDAISIDWLLNHYMVASPSDTIEYIHMAENHNQIIDEIISLWRAEQAERK